MRHPPLIALAILACLALNRPAPSQANRPPVPVKIHVAVERAVAPDGTRPVVPWQLVTNLAGDDFEILVDGAPCPLTSFSTAAGPVALAVLLDVSNSARVPTEWLGDPLEKSLIPMLEPADRASFSRFGGTDMLLGGFASSPRDMVRAARDSLALPKNLKTFGLGASPAWDAVDAAATALESQDARRAIILVTDGRSTGNVRSVNEAMLHAVVAQVSVLVVGEAQPEVIRWAGNPVTRVYPDALLRAMADRTGGAYIDLFGPEATQPTRATVKRSLGRALEVIADDLRKMYTLSFVPPVSDGLVHRLEVRVKKPGLKARAPQAYKGRSGG